MKHPLVRELVAERPRPTFTRCSYCGAPCTGRACGSHRILLVLDPHFPLNAAAAEREHRPRQRATFTRCSYCGAPCIGAACAKHRDLIVLDPHHQLKRKEA